MKWRGDLRNSNSHAGTNVMKNHPKSLLKQINFGIECVYGKLKYCTLYILIIVAASDWNACELYIVVLTFLSLFYHALSCCFFVNKNCFVPTERLAIETAILAFQQTHKMHIQSKLYINANKYGIGRDKILSLLLSSSLCCFTLCRSHVAAIYYLLPLYFL